MIRAIRANEASFREVQFGPTFNVVLADRTRESTKKDSRNGLGKSSLIEIIHFCLGANTSPRKGLRVEPLKGWEFSLDLLLGGRELTVSRSVDSPGKYLVTGLSGGRRELSQGEWTEFLGQAMFCLTEEDLSGRFHPTFRSLLSYFARRGRDAFSIPFEHHRKQVEWDRQVANAFLLGLGWRNAQQWQELKETKKVLGNLKKAAKAGVIDGILGTVGELEAELVRLQEAARQQQSSLESFRVHPEYETLEREASELTREIHGLSNLNIADRRMLALYQQTLDEVEEDDVDAAELERLYAEANVTLPSSVVRRLEEVKVFHETIVSNRRGFLAEEIGRVLDQIERREQEILDISGRRAEVMEVLREHGALAEYTKLQQRYLNTVAEINELENSISNLRKFEAGQSSLRIEQERLLQRARREHDERHLIREKAISLFNAHSEALYQAPGRLVLDIGSNGFTFGVEIERSGSQGVDSMKVFCYDLMLAELWADRECSPGFLVHDSALFDGVDERQVALALERAAQVSERAGFQYICTLNSDALPRGEFSDHFDLDQWVRLRLTDVDPSGSLFGMRF